MAEWNNKTVIERAFEIARDQKIERMDDLKKLLVKEGYLDVGAQLDSSPSLRAQLRAAARGVAQ